MKPLRDFEASICDWLDVLARCQRRCKFRIGLLLSDAILDDSCALLGQLIHRCGLEIRKVFAELTSREGGEGLAGPLCFVDVGS